MTKANRKFRAPPLFRFMHPRGSFRDFTYIRLVNYRQRKDAEAGVKTRKRKDQKAINNHKQTTTWEYVAGFFDGEGSVSPLNKEYRRISIAQNTWKVLSEIKASIGMGTIYQEKIGMFRLQIFRQAEVLSFLRGVSPYLIVKKEACDKAIQYLEQFSRTVKQGNMVKPSRNAKDAAAKLGIQIQNGFEIAKKWKNDNEYEKKNNERADAI